MQSLSCPACGAPVTVNNRFVKLVVCDFCHQALLFNNGNLDPTGRTATLVDLPSQLYVDASGTIRGRPFRVLGRLRYRYDRGRWDEWFLLLDGKEPAWLEEDEGTFKLLRKVTITDRIPAYASINVGEVVTIQNYAVFVTEKREAEIAGGEGQLSFQVLPGEVVSYIDGVANRQRVAVEYGEDEIELLLGEELEAEELIIDEEEM